MGVLPEEMNYCRHGEVVSMPRDPELDHQGIVDISVDLRCSSHIRETRE